MKILNIAAGKFNPLLIDGENITMPRYVVNVDTSYFHESKAEDIENDIVKWENDCDRISTYKYLNIDIFQYMERTRIKFDKVVIYRFLEHVSFTQVEYFIYLVSTVLRKSGIVDIIVPNYRLLGEMLINEENYWDDYPEFDFKAWNILLTTELLNEPSCPHASIWTDKRMKYFWELEERFQILNQTQAFKFDGRDIYLRSIIKRK